MSKNVAHYGLHKDEYIDTWWLFQKLTAINSIGLPDKELNLKMIKKFSCPHEIELVQSKPPMYDRLMRHELVKYMGPAPYKSSEKCVYVVTPTMEEAYVLTYLTHLFSPNQCVVSPRTMGKYIHESLYLVLNSSNLSRYVITGFGVENINQIKSMVQVSFGVSGRLFLAGDMIHSHSLKSIVPILTIPPELVSFVMNNRDPKLYKDIGAHSLYRFMRGEEV